MERMETWREACLVPLERMKRVSDAMLHKMDVGLAETGTNLPMLPTYVTQQPSGKETGHYLTLDLGGTNFRIAYIQLSEEISKVALRREAKWNIPKENMEGTADGLFGLLAEAFKEFLDQLELDGIPLSRDKIVLAFTFSFPMDQNALNSGKLLFWTKGFNIPSCVGKDVVVLLADAMHRAGIHGVVIPAVLNDTVGTLAAAQYFDETAKVGVIFGTGSNAAYVEEMEKIEKMQGKDHHSKYMVVDIEWSDFYTAELPIMSFDRKLDEESLHPGKATFEKMIGGMYIGEMARNMLLELLGDDALPAPSPQGRKFLATNDAIGGEQVAAICALQDVLGEPLLALTESLGYDDEAIKKAGPVIQEIMFLVSRRAARLAGAALYSVLRKMGRVGGVRILPTIIAVDGSMFEHHRLFHEELIMSLTELVGPEAEKIKLQLSKDGSGLGAAIIAAVADLGAQ